MATKPSRIDLLSERLRQFASIERLMLMRNLGYGGAAACLVVLVGLTQVGAKEVSLKVSVFSAAFALPLWLLLGGIYELYIFLGKQSYPHLRSKFAVHFTSVVFLFAGLGSVATTTGVIWFLVPEAAMLFLGTCVLVAILGSIFHVLLARWWFGVGGPGASGSNKDV
jgi:hypothetical protein